MGGGERQPLMRRFAKQPGGQSRLGSFFPASGRCPPIWGVSFGSANTGSAPMSTGSPPVPARGGCSFKAKSFVLSALSSSAQMGEVNRSSFRKTAVVGSAGAHFFRKFGSGSWGRSGSLRRVVNPLAFIQKLNSGAGHIFMDGAERNPLIGFVS